MAFSGLDFILNVSLQKNSENTDQPLILATYLGHS